MTGSPREVALEISQLPAEEGRRYVRGLIDEVFERYERSGRCEHEQFKAGLDFLARLSTELRELGVPPWKAVRETA